MNLPDNLERAIQDELDTVGIDCVKKAYENLSNQYRGPRSEERRSFLKGDSAYISYIAARMPATYAAVSRVLEEVSLRTQELEIKSLLDLGAGPGTASWAALSVFKALQHVTLVERDANMISLGIRLAEKCNSQLLQRESWKKLDLESTQEFPLHDIVILSFSLGELSEKGRESVISAAFKAANNLLIVVEPGTPRGYEHIIEIRKSLIEKGGNILAPCPHNFVCPMKKGDWCHFSCRLDRTISHRRIKSGSLGYEDEKFSYLVVSKSSVKPAESRVLRHPLKRSGHLHLTLCTQDGIKEKTFSKKHGDLYKEARDLEWGDGFSFTQEKE